MRKPTTRTEGCDCGALQETLPTHRPAPASAAPSAPPTHRPEPAPVGANGGELEGRLSRAVRHIEDGFLLTDEQGVVVVWNPKMEEFFGIPAADALGRPLWELHARLLPGDPPGRDRERVGRESREAIEAALAGEPTQAAMTLNRVGEAHVSDGSSRRSVQLLPFSAETDGGFVVGAVCRDTTAMRRELAEEARTERLTALQDLARGVAHDFNNLLTTILGSAGSAREELQDVAWDLESIHRHLVRAEEAVLEAW